ncbi:hypothetical protein ACSSWA_11295 [Melioribacter sp. Ez-97]|uniref:hypothetical protein n=1 Tax=Melioribacter sp. Ez-97 TaxID=3423434 RepID=UPI003ED88FAE
MKKIEYSLTKLINYIESEGFKGYDPYDTLNSRFNFQKLGRWPAIILTQVQKRNPINIRPILGIRKDFNSKAMGLFLESYSMLYVKTKNEKFKNHCNFFYNWLLENYSKGYSGYCWGYNFPWATPKEYVNSLIPSSVATAAVIKGLYQFFKITGDKKIPDIINSSSRFIVNDLHMYEDDSGKCFSYTPLGQDVCYNASLFAGEILAINYKFNKDNYFKKICIDLVNFVVSKQKKDGRWNYSFDIKTGKEREQIDFHQGYILVSIYNIKNLLEYSCSEWEDALKKGLRFYYENQFFKNGQSLWRIPKNYPVDIHNQSQGIITFKMLQEYGQIYDKFAHKIAEWTIDNMQLETGYFIYRKNRFIKNKIPYMRWGQAWMLRAFTELI